MTGNQPIIVNEAESSVNIDQRILEVQHCITDGLNLQEIYKFAQSKWKIDAATAREYVRKARERFADIPEEEWKAARGVLLSQCNDLYKKSYAADDFRTCLEILKYISRMFKLDGEDEKKETIIINFEGRKLDEYD